MICPCKGCEKAGCGEYHDTCERYLAWTDERKAYNNRRHAEDDCRQLSRDHEMKYRKNLKQGRKRGG